MGAACSEFGLPSRLLLPLLNDAQSPSFRTSPRPLRHSLLGGSPRKHLQVRATPRSARTGLGGRRCRARTWSWEGGDSRQAVTAGVSGCGGAQRPAPQTLPSHLASSTEQRSRRPRGRATTSRRRWISPCTSSSGSTSVRWAQPLKPAGQAAQRGPGPLPRPRHSTPPPSPRGPLKLQGAGAVVPRDRWGHRLGS